MSYKRCVRASVICLSLALVSSCRGDPATLAPIGGSALFAGMNPDRFDQKTQRTLLQARAFAKALRDSAFREVIFRELQWSRLPEHKLIWKGVLDRRRVAASSALARGGSGSDSLAIGDSGEDGLAFYVPVREHRKTWRGDARVLVAVQVRSTDPVIAYGTDGSATELADDRPPATPVIAITLQEVSTSDSSHAVGAQVATTAYGLRVLAAMSMEELPSCGEFIETCGGGSGGGGPPPPYSPPGLYMTQMNVRDKAEPWIRGDPEIELVLMGTVSGRYYALQWPNGAQSDLAYQAGEFFVPVACSGRLAPSALKLFDFNSEQLYPQQVLVEERDEFEVSERVEGVSHTVLHSRRTGVHAPFIVQAWERDDGGECPKVATPWMPTFHIGYSVHTDPKTYQRVVALQAGGASGWWASLLGITNENDLLGSWPFNTWDDFEAINTGSLYSGSHVDVRFDNTGVNRYNVPTGVP